MATLTATAAASTGVVRALHAGVTSITSTYSGTTAISPSATAILMAKIPNGATILDIQGSVSSGADTCPFTLGISNGTASTFATGGTVNTVLRGTKGLPYNVSLSDDATPQYVYVTATVVPGTVTTEVEMTVTTLYTMDR
jgi:hypothetical protein